MYIDETLYQVYYRGELHAVFSTARQVESWAVAATFRGFGLDKRDVRVVAYEKEYVIKHFEGKQ